MWTDIVVLWQWFDYIYLSLCFLFCNSIPTTRVKHKKMMMMMMIIITIIIIIIIIIKKIITTIIIINVNDNISSYQMIILSYTPITTSNGNINNDNKDCIVKFSIKWVKPRGSDLIKIILKSKWIHCFPLRMMKFSPAHDEKMIYFESFQNLRIKGQNKSHPYLKLHLWYQT